MTVFVLLFLITLFVAYANGANDNFKGVATLYGANVADYRTAITLATIATFLGCVASVFFAEALIKAFSGKGLVPDALAASPIFLLAVGTGAGITVILAALLGFPISTTHGLTGALVGGGLVAAGDELNLGVLGSAFFLPLLLSPVISILLTMPFYKAGHGLSKWFGVRQESCVCVAPGHFVPVAAFTGLAPETISPRPLVVIGTAPACMDKVHRLSVGDYRPTTDRQRSLCKRCGREFRARPQRRAQDPRSVGGDDGVAPSGQHVGSGCRDGDRRLAKCPQGCRDHE
jgi:inorganic phosphate transporter, PiT family